MDQAVKDKRDGVGRRLGFRQDSASGLWWGKCPTCGERDTCVGLLSLTCPKCGAITLGHAVVRWGRA